LKDKVTLIKENGDTIGFRINDKEFYSEEEGFVEVEISDLKGFNIGSIPNSFCFHLFEGEYEWDILSDKKYVGISSVNLHIYRKYWDHKFGALQYVNVMKKAIEIRKKSEEDVEFTEIDDDGAHIFLRFDIFLLEDMPINKALRRFKQIVEEIEGHTERILEGEEISSEILNDEKKFALELLLPLFRNMGFVDVKYNHGKREFGKDVTFSEIDKFGVRRNYGVQVKAGDLSGEAGAEIDKIIAQIEDAFKMPYVNTTSREKRYISDLIVAISGRFTDNAKDKIIEKVNRRNLYFLDIDKIQELLTQYMKKKVTASKQILLATRPKTK
jgi:hypothetical protein